MPIAAPLTFDPQLYVIDVNNHVISAWDSCTVTRGVDEYEFAPATNHETGYKRNPNTYGTITIEISHQGKLDKDFIRQLSDSGTNFTTKVTDGSGTKEAVVAKFCRVQKQFDSARANNPVKWTVVIMSTDITFPSQNLGEQTDTTAEVTGPAVSGQ